MKYIKYTDGMMANVYIFFWNREYITLIQTLDSPQKAYLKYRDKRKQKSTAKIELLANGATLELDASGNQLWNIAPNMFEKSPKSEKIAEFIRFTLKVAM